MKNTLANLWLTVERWLDREPVQLMCPHCHQIYWHRYGKEKEYPCPKCGQIILNF